MGVGEERLSQMSKRYMQLSVFINQFLEAGAAKPGLLDAEYRAKSSRRQVAGLVGDDRGAGKPFPGEVPVVKDPMSATPTRDPAVHFKEAHQITPGYVQGDLPAISS